MIGGYVGRDGRDIFMSLWNHQRNFKPEMFDLVNNTPGRVGDPLPLPPDDVHQFFQNWINRGWFPWEREGYPMWSVLNHSQTWWDYRRLPNILLVHFSDLLSDLDGQMRRIAKYLNIEIDETIWPTLVDNATFKAMKSNADNVAPGGGKPFVGGSESFLHRGKNNRWQGVLSADELALYQTTVSEVLTSDCANWLEQGQAGRA